ncbi:hypothetical protein Glove_520g11 [Diversispora epigaea]|uniref:Uncharacterized protein n=1 Tax=Diversispora epigaea TaxID=1348612 RepID=A0A397GEP9_9GLOM|nr:hypothetical protein Glove_520g11 [Diversispora epigaea]
MNTKFTFALCFTILFSVILSVYAHDDVSKYRKRSPGLFKRSHEKNDTCPCTVATSVFTKNVVIGEVVFAQDPCGKTLVTGLFSDGLPDPEKNCYDYLIVKCDKVLYNLTSAIDPKYRKNGTYPFSTRLNDLNLDCDSNGILVSPCVSCNDTYHKRQATPDPTLNIYAKGDGNRLVDLSTIG